MSRVVVYRTIRWRGSITDLATDAAALLTKEEGLQLIAELQRFQDKPHLADKWAGDGFREDGIPTSLDLWLQNNPSAARVWRSVLQINPRIELPTCGTEEDGSVYLGWNPGPRSLDISISKEGVVKWFYAEYHTKVLVSSDDDPSDGYLGFVGLFTKKATS